MAVREDWTRITQSIQGFISAFMPSRRGASKRICTSVPTYPKAQRTMILVRSTMNPRFLAEIERKRNPAYMSSLRNQIR